jgi:murein DD-endopeptidase MepM/ murein hydrolase activator NlpD
MAKKKPTLVFNHSNLTFEQKKISWQQKLMYGLMITSGVLVFGFISVMLSHKIFPSPNEQNLRRQIKFMQKEYSELESRLGFIAEDLHTLRKRDENLYRVIYQREPIDDDIWKTAETTNGKFDIIKEKSDYQIIADVLAKMEVTRNKMKLQEKSYTELTMLVKRKDDMINSIPSIQPITNKELTRISSGFGWRLHPIYRIPKKHTGIDFTAPTGTPIYVTGDGIVEACQYEGGYGSSIIINHGYGYKTRYAHLSKYATSSGLRVKRGSVIGYVGSTGASVGPHLHYEVEYLDQKVDPALFFYNDLSKDQFEELIKITNASGKSFD